MAKHDPLARRRVFLARAAYRLVKGAVVLVLVIGGAKLAVPGVAYADNPFLQPPAIELPVLQPEPDAGPDITGKVQDVVNDLHDAIAPHEPVALLPPPAAAADDIAQAQEAVRGILESVSVAPDPAQSGAAGAIDEIRASVTETVEELRATVQETQLTRDRIDEAVRDAVQSILDQVNEVTGSLPIPPGLVPPPPVVPPPALPDLPGPAAATPPPPAELDVAVVTAPEPAAAETFAPPASANVLPQPETVTFVTDAIPATDMEPAAMRTASAPVSIAAAPLPSEDGSLFQSTPPAAAQTFSTVASAPEAPLATMSEAASTRETPRPRPADLPLPASQAPTESSPRFERIPTFLACLPSSLIFYSLVALALVLLSERKPRSWHTSFFTPPR